MNEIFSISPSIMSNKVCHHIHQMKGFFHIYFIKLSSVYTLVVRQLMTTFEKDGDMPDKSTNFFPGTHQVLSYNSETGTKRFKKSEASMSNFCNNGKLTLAKILEKKPTYLYPHNNLSECVNITTFCYILCVIKGSGS